MIPQHTLADPPTPAPFLDAKADTVEPTTDYETGGIGLQDPSEGLQYQTWTCKTDGTTITIEADNTPPVTVYTGNDITEVSLAFDSNMNYFVAFVEGGQAKYKWWDISINDFKVSLLDASDINPRCTLDDKREFNSAGRDIILAYLRNNILYMREQRDSYAIERGYATVTAGKKLAKIGMGTNLSMQHLLADSLTTETPAGTIYPPEDILAFSFFIQPKVDFSLARALGFGKNQSAISVDYTDAGLYVALPNGQNSDFIEPADGFVEDVKGFVAVNVYLTPDDRPGKGFRKITNIDLFFVDTGVCGSVIKKSNSFYEDELGGSHALAVFDSDTKIFIGGDGAVNFSKSFMSDEIWVRDYKWDETEVDQYLEDLGICVPPPPEPDPFSATPQQSGSVVIIQKDGGPASVSTAEMFVTMGNGSESYEVTYTVNPNSEFSQVTDNPNETMPNPGIIALPYVVSGVDLVDNGDGTKTAKAWMAGYSPASGYDIEPGGSVELTGMIDWVAEDLVTSDTVSGTFQVTVTIFDQTEPME